MSTTPSASPRIRQAGRWVGRGPTARKGAAGSPRSAKRLVADAVRTTRRPLDKDHRVLVRTDSAFYDRGVGSRADGQASQGRIASIGDDAWTSIEYTDAAFDEATGRWISPAEVAEIEFTAFAAQKKTDHVPGRPVVRRIPDFQAGAVESGFWCK